MKSSEILSFVKKCVFTALSFDSFGYCLVFQILPIYNQRSFLVQVDSVAYFYSSLAAISLKSHNFNIAYIFHSKVNSILERNAVLLFFLKNETFVRNTMR